jgi:hypothetical protein
MLQGETNITRLLKAMKPRHNPGKFVFCVVDDLARVDPADIILLFKEQEANTIVTRKDVADGLELNYSFIAAWITLTVHSSLEAVGLTAAVSTALAEAAIACNVVAAYFHDHIFVAEKDTEKAMHILENLSKDV